MEDASSTVYLRPETAQGIFVNFKNVMETTRVKVPFGIAQQGKSFRNEIVVRNFLFRMREFEQMECEFFCVPGTEETWFEHWKQYRLDWWKDLGVRPSRLRLRPHEKDELAHYAKACVDIEYLFPFGWKEVEGIASRADFDLKAHQAGSGKGLAYLDEATKQWVVPYVVEPAAGVDRCFLTVLTDAYEEETKANGETRVVLHLHPKLAPVQVGVYPLVKKDGMPERGRAIFDALKDVLPLHLRRVGDGRQALRARRRGRDALGRDDRQPDDDGRHRHGPRPRLDGAGARPRDASCWPTCSRRRRRGRASTTAAPARAA